MTGTTPGPVVDGEDTRRGAGRRMVAGLADQPEQRVGTQWCIR